MSSSQVALLLHPLASDEPAPAAVAPDAPAAAAVGTCMSLLLLLQMVTTMTM